jgi:uncharacterized RDD family membrane protein YckC
MSTVRIATNFNIDIEFTAPPFYRRVAAWIIDMVVMIFYIIIATKLLTVLTGNVSRKEGNGVTIWAISLLLMLPFLLYHVVMEATMNGQSIGKKILGIKVISENGGRPSLSQLIIRWLIRTSDYTLLIMIVLIPYASIMGPQIYWGIAGALTLLIADLVLVNTRKQQRLGDILAHTVLINISQKEKLTDTIFLEVADNYVPQFPQIMQLSDRDINTLKGIIDVAKSQKDYNMAYVASEKIKSHLKIDTYLEPEDFLQVLLKDYNYLSTN